MLEIACCCEATHVDAFLGRGNEPEKWKNSLPRKRSKADNNEHQWNRIFLVPTTSL